MKKITSAAGAVALFAGVAQADLLITAPGLPDAGFVPTSGTINTQTFGLMSLLDPDALATFNEYRITAITYVLKGGIPVELGSLPNSGKLPETRSNQVSIKIIGSSGEVDLGSTNELTVNKYGDTLTGSFTLSGSELVLEDSSIQIQVTQHFDLGALKSDYSYIEIEGTYIRNEPEVVGDIRREPTSMDKVMTTEDHCPVEYKLSLAAVDPNKGMGNNEDSVDGSNQNAISITSNWARSGKIEIVDGSVLDDDEM